MWLKLVFSFAISLMLIVGGCQSPQKSEQEKQFDAMAKQGYGFGNPNAEKNRQKRLAERNRAP